MAAPHPLIELLTVERMRREIPVAVLARRLGYTPEAVRNWEAGRKAPSLVRLEDYATALGYQLALQRQPRAPQPPITLEQAAQNRRVLADALGITDDTPSPKGTPRERRRFR